MPEAIKIHIDVKDGTHFDEFEGIFEESMMPVMEFSTLLVLGSAIENSPTYRGYFRQSLDTEIYRALPRESLTMVGQIFSSSTYAGVIEGVDEEGNETEYGRRPGTAFPNIGELKLWVETVITIERVIAHYVERNPNSEIPDAETLLHEATLNVGRKIVRDGIKPVRPIGKALQQHQGEIQQELEKGINAALSKL